MGVKTTKSNVSETNKKTAPPLKDKPASVRTKTAYHHGGLREALTGAAFQLVCEHGAEQFTVADACRLAGVSTAAPYKHFRDRDEILEAVVSMAFEVMTDLSMQAVARHGAGTLDGISAMGEAYIEFATEHQYLFRLMFGQNPAINSAENVVAEGRECFAKVIEQVALFCIHNDVGGDPTEIAARLWTFVHGAASLTIHGDYDKVVPDLNVKHMVRETTPILLNLKECVHGSRNRN